MTDKEALKQALEALENLFDTNEHGGGVAVWRLEGFCPAKRSHYGPERSTSTARA